MIYHFCIKKTTNTSAYLSRLSALDSAVDGDNSSLSKTGPQNGTDYIDIGTNVKKI